MLVMIIIGGAAALVAAFIILRKHSSAGMPDGWTAITAGKDYGAKVEPSGSFDFPEAPGSVHYVTKACGALSGAQGLRIRYRIDADETVKFLMMELSGKIDTPKPGTIGLGPVLYLQRKGDDWSGSGAFETYRWWATFNPREQLAPGEHEVVAMFDQRWTAVEGSNSIDQAAAFRAALADAARVGFTFPGVTGEGHGVTCTGKARFTLLEFTVV